MYRYFCLGCCVISIFCGNVRLAVSLQDSCVLTNHTPHRRNTLQCCICLLLVFLLTLRNTGSNGSTTIPTTGSFR
jgi:hypothetical protein